MGWLFDRLGLLMTSKPLSPTTLAVWRFLAAYIDEHGYAPSYREISDGCGVALVGVARHLDRLDERGVIELTGRARAIRLVERPPH